ncbi:aldo/keto reductase [Candidatus Fermentibacteria bacterium]|nr:aldo/keto reductase [Candidatus Fermentibacteria bacterium]
MMLYRKLGRSGARLSALGFGCMRFLTKKGRPTWGANFDSEAALRLLHETRELGVNYFDTAYNYMGNRSENLLGRFLREIPGGSVLVATKYPVWKARHRNDFLRLFNVQMKRLGTDGVDLYLLHSLNGKLFEKARTMGILDFLDRLRSEGRVGLAGFSFHDAQESFGPIADAYDWDFCQIQYNIIDETVQAAGKSLEHAARKGLGVVVMEPLRGGALVGSQAPAVARAWEKSGGRRSKADWCLSWIWNRPEVSIVLSGMNTPGQLRENARIASRARPGSMTREELSVVAGVRKAYENLRVSGCTGCGYCMPCPFGVAIPSCFVAFDEARMLPGSDMPVTTYRQWLRPEQKADRCTGCGRCEERCPQNVGIREKLREVVRLFGGPSDR